MKAVIILFEEGYWFLNWNQYIEKIREVFLNTSKYKINYVFDFQIHAIYPSNVYAIFHTQLMCIIGFFRDEACFFTSFLFL